MTLPLPPPPPGGDLDSPIGPWTARQLQELAARYQADGFAAGRKRGHQEAGRAMTRCVLIGLALIVVLQIASEIL